MHSKVIELRAIEFNKTLIGLSFEQAAVLIALEIESLKKRYTLSSARSALGAYRKTASKELKPLFAVTKDEQYQIERNYNKKIVEKSNAMEQIDMSGLIKTAVGLLDSSKVSEVICALALLTGRRLAEIVCTIKLSATATPNKAAFVGQLKKRENETNGYEIFILSDFAKIKEAANWVRTKAGDLTAQQGYRKYSNAAAAACLQHFEKYLGYCSTHDLRKAYAAIIVHLYKPKSVSQNAFLSKNLGHSDSDLTTANVYQKYFV